MQHDTSGHRDRRSRKRQASSAASRPTLSHPLFGEIPLITARTRGPSGEVIEYLDYDPDYEPTLPHGAVRGDVRRQDYCCHVPRYFYTDQQKSCVQCGQEFLFGASEQKYWYETRKFHFDSVAIRCPTCRRTRRTERALHQQLSAAKSAVAATPGDPAPLLDLAAAIIQLYERTGHGALDEAIAASRKAAKAHQSPGGSVALFWEAAAHAHAGRHSHARELFSEFVARAKHVKRWKQHVREAERRMRALPPA